MEIQNANDHPFKVAIVQDADMFANDHPFKVYVEGGGGGGEARVVTELPETGESGYIYLVLKEETSEGDIYDEWIWALQADGTTYGWEHLGTTNEVTIKLYDTEGNNTDGAATQRLVTSLKGQARILTSADYNANSSNWSDTNPANFNCIALWLLEPGVYTTTKDENLTVKYYKSGNLLAGFNTFIIGNERDGYCPAIILRHKINAGAENASYYQMKKDGSQATALQLIDSYSMVTNLTNTSAYKPLAANQGKVLKDLIDSLAIRGAGAPDTTTVGQVGTLYEDTTNGDLYICTDATNPYVWEEVGGGGSYTAGDGIDITNAIISATNTGKAKELTTANYNWPVDNPVSIALWLLEPGMYYWADDMTLKQSIYWMRNKSVFTSGGQATGAIINSPVSRYRNTILIGQPSVDGGILYGRVSLDGYDGSLRSISFGLADNLTTISGGSALDARQGRVLKGLIDAIVVPTQTSDLTNDGSDGTSTYVEADDLAAVATSGSYNDLSNTPTIPTVNDSTITLTNNGTTVDSFTTNASSNKTIALSAPEITMTSTDPGEGQPLAENQFIGVY